MNVYKILGPFEVLREKLEIQSYMGKDKLPDLPSDDTQWKDAAHDYKEKVAWKCAKCGRDFSQNKGVLGVYPKNGDKKDIRLENLTALCDSCKGESLA